MSKKIDFIIIGAMKSGTTTVAEILDSHKGIEISTPKEPMYFLKNGYCKAQNDDEYHEFWESKTTSILKGEASTMYSGFPEYKGVAQNIYEYNPKTKIIFLVRNPVDRIESHYAYRLSRGVNTKESMEDEILNDSRFLERSMYFMQIREYDNVFPKEQIKIVFFEDFLENKIEFIDDLIQFIGVDVSETLKTDVWANRSTNTKRLNRTGKRLAKIGLHNVVPPFAKKALKKFLTVSISKKPEFTESFKKELIEELKEDIILFESRTGKDLSEWKKVS